MMHNCTESNTKFDCRCGKKCGYVKDGTCLYHRELKSRGKLDTTIIAMCLGSIEEVCHGSLQTLCTLAEDKLLYYSRDERKKKISRITQKSRGNTD